MKHLDTELLVDGDASVLSVRHLLAQVWAGRLWIVASALLVSAACTAAAFLMTPKYRASVVLSPVVIEGAAGGGLGSALGQISGLASLAGIAMGSSNQGVDEALAVLRSREFTESFVQELNLMPVLYSGLWDAEAGAWRPDVEKTPTSWMAYRYFDRSIRSIKQDKATGLVTLTIDWRDRELTAEWANRLVQKLNSEMRERAIEQSKASMGFLREELANTSDVGTRDAINRLIESQVRQRMLANVKPDYAFRVIDKALAPDADDVVSPNKLLLIAGGPVVGVLLGAFLVLVFRRSRGSDGASFWQEAG
ncbi:MAG: Wzz/FepE/Etk N-terminal domain-containing protein [Steroidobacteraceae bacterium]